MTRTGRGLCAAIHDTAEVSEKVSGIWLPAPPTTVWAPLSLFQG